MAVHELYLESGPKHRKTMVHVLGLLGCVAVGPTTEEAVAAVPAAIEAYSRFLTARGEPVEHDAVLEIRVAEHVTEGDFIGNGSPYITFAPDLVPLSDAEVTTLLRRHRWLCETLADWAAAQSDEQLDARPESGRTARGILLHVLGAGGSYLSPALGSAPGFGALSAAVERGEVPPDAAFRRLADLVEARVRATTPDERAAVRDLPKGKRTLRKALRRMLEHAWEHLAELSRRPGGPRL